MSVLMDYLRVGGRLIALLLNQLIFTLVGLGLYFLYRHRQKKRLRYIAIFSRHWARWSCFILNIRVRVTGEPAPPPGSLIVSNHIGMTDIYALGSCFETVFVAKQDISRWPLVGWTARLGGVVFVDRSKRHAVSAMVAETAQRLQHGCSVAIFPEGGIAEDVRIRVFKTSAFEAAVISGVAVAPTLISYADSKNPAVARWGGKNFLTHIIGLMKNRRLDVTLTILPSIRVEPDRRVIAKHCYDAISKANAGQQEDCQP